MSLLAEVAPSRSLGVPEDARRRPLSFVPDGQWQPGVRRPAAVGLAGRAPQWGTDLPGSLLTELAGLAVDDPSRVRLRARVIDGTCRWRRTWPGGSVAVVSRWMI